MAIKPDSIIQVPNCQVCERPMHEVQRNATTIQYACSCQSLLKYKNIHIVVFMDAPAAPPASQPPRYGHNGPRRKGGLVG